MDISDNDFDIEENMKTQIFSSALPNYTCPSICSTTFLCAGCGDKFYFESSYDDHIKRTSVLIEHVCQVCNQILNFTNRCALLCHVKTHVDHNPIVSSNYFKVKPIPNNLLDKVILEYKNDISNDSLTTDIPQHDTQGCDSGLEIDDTTKECNNLSQSSENKSSDVRTPSVSPALPNKNDSCSTIAVMNDYEAEESTFTCNFCHKTIINPDETLSTIKSSHFQRIVSDDTPLPTCDICVKPLSNKCAQAAHQTLHSSSPPYVCPECGCSMKSLKLLQKHVTYVCFHYSRVMYIKCFVSNCGQVVSVELFNGHFFERHMKKLYLCKMCQHTTTLIRYMRTHIKSKHPTVRNPRYKSIVNLIEMNPIYSCTYCHKKMAQSDINMHLSSHTKLAMKSCYYYSCPACKDNHKTLNTFQLHLSSCQKYINTTILKKKGTKKTYASSDSLDNDLQSIFDENAEANSSNDNEIITNNIFDEDLPTEINQRNTEHSIIKKKKSITKIISPRIVPEIVKPNHTIDTNVYVASIDKKNNSETPHIDIDLNFNKNISPNAAKIVSSCVAKNPNKKIIINSNERLNIDKSYSDSDPDINANTSEEQMDVNKKIVQNAITYLKNNINLHKSKINNVLTIRKAQCDIAADVNVEENKKNNKITIDDDVNVLQNGVDPILNEIDANTRNDTYLIFEDFASGGDEITNSEYVTTEASTKMHQDKEINDNNSSFDENTTKLNIIKDVTTGDDLNMLNNLRDNRNVPESTEQNTEIHQDAEIIDNSFDENISKSNIELIEPVATSDNLNMLNNNLHDDTNVPKLTGSNTEMHQDAEINDNRSNFNENIVELIEEVATSDKLSELEPIPVRKSIEANNSDLADNKSLQIYSCKVCTSNFNEKREFTTHIRRHRTIARPFQCMVCGICFDDKMELPRHLKVEHTTNKSIAQVKANENDNTSNNRRKVKHVVRKSPTSIIIKAKRYRRNNGFSKKKRKRYLNAKLEESKVNAETLPVTNDDKKYTCTRCLYVSESADDFRTHMMSHRDVSQANLCIKCGNCFATKISLSTHLSIIHNITEAERNVGSNERYTKVDNYQCKICKQSFSDEYDLGVHFRQHGMAFLKQNANK